MKRFLIFLLVLSLVGCSTPNTGDTEKPDDIVEEPKVPTTVNEVLQSLDYYDTLFDGNEADVLVYEDSLSIKQKDLSYTTSYTYERYGRTYIQMFFRYIHEIEYVKQGETKTAELVTNYTVNDESSGPERLISCILKANNNKDRYYFFYDQNANTIYLYNEEYQEEIYFVEDLQNKIKEICRNDYSLFDTKYRQMDSAVKELYKFLEWDVVWAEERGVSVHRYGPEEEFKPIIHPAMPSDQLVNVLFGKDNVDSVIPLFFRSALDIEQELYVVSKNERMGIIDTDGNLIVPYYAISTPYIDNNEIHCSNIDPENIFFGPVPSTKYHVCVSGHGICAYNYYYSIETDELVSIGGCDDLPESSSSPINLALMEDSLSVYHGIISYYITEPNGFPAFERTNKYGVFSKNGKVTDAIYDYGLPTKADLAAVQKNGLWGYVNAEGIEVIPCQYDYVFTLHDEQYAYPALNNSIVLKNTEGYFGVVDYSGNTLLDFKYDWISPFTDGNVLVKTNNEWHIVDPFTQQIIK